MLKELDLQLFAEDGDGGDNGAGEGEEAKKGAEVKEDHVGFDEFMKVKENQAELDRRISKAVNTAVNNARGKMGFRN